jgi:uncharacterized protein
MLSLNLATIRSAHERIEQVYDPAQLGGDGDNFSVVAPITLATDVFKDKDHFRLAGSVSATLELSCSRCLEPFPWPVDASFDLRFQPKEQNVGEGELEIEENDLSTAFYEDQTIDLGQLMREQFYLSLPMKPLCRTDCKGLCPSCGTNFNRGTCSCRSEWQDPRFAALKTFTKDS